MSIKDKERAALIQELVKDTNEQLGDDEEQMHLLLSKRLSIVDDDEQVPFSQRAADSVARFAGSWAFIISFLAVMAAWMTVNVLMAAKAFDGYPFILLNLLLSCIAAVQAPLIMMSQNRQESKDRARSENSYRVNLKNELVIADLHDKLDQVLENQKRLAAAVEKLEAQKRD